MWTKKRDINKALELLTTIREENGSSAAIEELDAQLRAMYPDTGRRDPRRADKRIRTPPSGAP